MPRALEEWVGKTDDQAPPPRVRVRVFERCGGRCHRCTRKVAAGERWTLEHLTALINGGANRESNLGVTCDWCLPAKNAEDVAEKSKTYQRKAAHLGVKPKKGRRLPGCKDGPWKQKVGGGWEWRR